MRQNDSAELSIKQQKALHALLTTTSIASAAQVAGVTDRTIYRWLDEETFRHALTEAEGRAIDAAARHLVGLTEIAVNRLTNILTDPQTPVALQLRAVETILENMIRLRGLRTLEYRLAKLEETYREQIY